MLDLAVDAFDHALEQGERRLQQPFHLVDLAQRGELQEDVVHVLADLLVVGEQAVIGVQPRRARVVVAGAQMRVVTQTFFFPPHHQYHLGVGLVTDDAVDDMCADVLELFGKVDVVGLIETRAQFDHHRDFLAGLGGLHQGIDDRALGAGAVQGLLDRQYVRIACGLTQEFDDRDERIEGVVQQHVGVAHRGEDVLALELTRYARYERLELQIGPVDQIGQRHQAIEVDRTVDLIHIRRVELHGLHQILPEMIRAVVGHLQTYRIAPLALR